MIKPRKIKTIVLFGGAGLVGFQVARQVAEHLQPETLVICALTQEEITPALAKLKQEFPHIPHIEGEYGNVFVRDELSRTSRTQIANNETHLNQIFNDVFGPITESAENIAQENLMVKIIMKYHPDAIIDTMNTATGISYQDVKSCTHVIKEFREQMGQLLSSTKENITDEIKALSHQPLDAFPHLDYIRMLDLLFVSQEIPQLIRHVTLLYKALLAANTAAYIKVGTTGTGGMGINIPFTHGEDKPSHTLMAKTAVAFAHTGLLFLLARAPGPMIKEIKPGAMIGYRRIDFRPIKKAGEIVKQWESKKETLKDQLFLREKPENYTNHGDLALVGIDTGENGFFTRAEYEAITYLNLMEFVTPEEIAHNVLFELCGHNTGKDVIAAIDGAVMDPSYRAGVIRQNTIKEMIQLENEKEIPSIAIGALGPPQLSKFLYETYLFQQLYSSLNEMVSDSLSPVALSQKLEAYVMQNTSFQQMVTSLGLPILLSDGKTILRGPIINIPESKVHTHVNISSENDIDQWAKRGWVDLRPSNMKVWQERMKKMLSSQQNIFNEGSACYTTQIYASNQIKTGEVVGWIFVNELKGGREK